MTNLKDLEECEKYNSLVYVEFLEFLCRCALSIHDVGRKEGDIALAVEDIVYKLISVLWAH